MRNGVMKIVVDIDGTICSQEPNYSDAMPYFRVIDKINRLYDKGYYVVLFTARGYETKIDWEPVTKKQLSDWGLKYHELLFNKPSADLYIDDKACNITDWVAAISCLKCIDKPWGKEYLLDLTGSYAMKRLELDAGKCISKQYHNYKQETWHIVRGEGTLLINDEVSVVRVGDTISIPPKTIHQVKALTDLTIIESSTTELDDIVRIRMDWEAL